MPNIKTFDELVSFTEFALNDALLASAKFYPDLPVPTIHKKISDEEIYFYYRWEDGHGHDAHIDKATREVLLIRVSPEKSITIFKAVPKSNHA